MNLNKPLRYFSNNAITAYFAVLIICSGLFLKSAMSLLWIVFGLLEVITFFYFSYALFVRWQAISEAAFQRKLFYTALIIRVVFVVCSYIFFNLMTGEPFEFETADAKGYHGEALWILDLLDRNELDRYFNIYLQGYSDSGWPMFLSVIYFFSFRSIMMARLINALFSAWMVLLIYRLANRNFGTLAARITTIMAMLFPIFIYYTGLHLKETLMVFLLVAFAERADYLIRKRTFEFGNVLLIVLLGLSLFFFRTVLAASAWFSLFSALMFSSKRILGRSRRLVNIAWFLVATFFIFSGTILLEVERYFYERNTNLEDQMLNFSLREGGNKLAQYGTQSIFIPLVILGPLPTLVNTNQLNANMINGNVFVRNVLVFFMFIALWLLFKHKLLKQHVLIIVLLFSYLFILSASGFALSERFHVPALPLILLFAGYGISKTNRQTISYYIPYLIFIALVIIAWNWFKLAGRGIV